jgi:hypothetical protein
VITSYDNTTITCREQADAMIRGHGTFNLTISGIRFIAEGNQQIIGFDDGRAMEIYNSEFIGGYAQSGGCVQFTGNNGTFKM